MFTILIFLLNNVLRLRKKPHFVFCILYLLLPTEKPGGIISYFLYDFQNKHCYNLCSIFILTYLLPKLKCKLENYV